ncbi:MAG: rhomboid family intramembrane serine protease [Myxococcales bacterium]|nr:rhomboid family intramembrane serine protease [Myxococcales bacterium]
MATGWSSRPEFAITRGASILLFLLIGVSLVYLLSSIPSRVTMLLWLGASADTVVASGRVWTLVTSPLLEPDGFSLLFQGALLWMFIPTLERWWGGKRFALCRCHRRGRHARPGPAGAAGLIDAHRPVMGLDPFTHAAIVAYGIVFARQPVQFFGAIPMTGRQLMLGILGLSLIFIVVNRAWHEGVAYVCAIAVAIVLTRANPLQRLRQWRRRRAAPALRSVPKDESTRWN